MTITPATSSYGPHAAQTADLYLPARPTDPSPVVVLVHGGYWRTPFDRTLMAPLAEDLAARGYAVWNIDYRRVGDEGAGGEHWQSTFDDVIAAMELLDELAPENDIDLEAIAVVGHSAGGHLALWLASEFGLSAVVSQAGVANLFDAAQDRLGLGSKAEGRGLVGVPATEELLGGTPDQVTERYAYASPSALLPLEMPILLVHGDADPLVPISQSRNFAEAAKEAGDPVELAEFPGVDHFQIIDPKHAAWARTVEFLDRELRD